MNKTLAVAKRRTVQTFGCHHQQPRSSVCETKVRTLFFTQSTQVSASDRFLLLSLRLEADKDTTHRQFASALPIMWWPKCVPFALCGTVGFVYLGFAGRCDGVGRISFGKLLQNHGPNLPGFELGRLFDRNRHWLAHEPKLSSRSRARPLPVCVHGVRVHRWMFR